MSNIYRSMGQALAKIRGIDEPRCLTEAPEDQEPASPDESGMAIDQLKFMAYAANEIMQHIQNGGEFPEWMQNKLSGTFEKMKSLHANIDHENVQDQKESVELEEKLKVSDGLGAWISDFKKSDAPQFKGKSDEEKKNMAIAAFTDAGGKLDEASDFKPHMMYDPKTGKAYKAEKPEDHERMAKMGYTHDKPEIDEAYKTPSEAKAYEDGKKAVAKKVSYDDNPNKKGTPEYTAWSKGHNDARAKMIGGKKKLNATYEEVELEESPMVTFTVPNVTSDMASKLERIAKEKKIEYSRKGSTVVLKGKRIDMTMLRTKMGLAQTNIPMVPVNEDVELYEAEMDLITKIILGTAMSSLYLPAVMMMVSMMLDKRDPAFDDEKVKTVKDMTSKFKKNKSYKPTSVEMDDAKKLAKEIETKKPNIFKRAMAKVLQLKSKNEALEEGKSSTGYELYHKDFSSAMKHAYDHAKSKFGIEIDPKEIDDKVASGPRKPSKGKTNTYRLKGKDGKKAVQIQVYGMDNGKYELNMYKESVELEESRKYRPEVLDKVLKIMNPTKSMYHAIPLIAKGMKVDEKEAEAMAKAVLRRDMGKKETTEHPMFDKIHNKLRERRK